MSDLILSPGQSAAHEMVGKFLKQTDVRIGKLTGYAGTGKTTLISVFAEAYTEPTILTPTGKAALRVHEATGLPASTIHRFLYDSKEDEKGKLVFTLKNGWSEDMADMAGKWVLIDEASMVGEDVWKDLVIVANAIGFHILLMGDLGQLPPVYKDKAGNPFSTLNLETPFAANLTEVHRQALDSPIIRASMLIRTGRPEHEAFALLKPVGASKLIEAILDARTRDGVVLCYTNARRHEINNRVREALGYAPGTLNEGEQILVTQNNYKLDRYNGEVVKFEGWTLEPTDEEARAVVDRFTQSALRMSFGVGLVGGYEAILSPEEYTGKAEAQKMGVSTIKKASRFWGEDHLEEEMDGVVRPPPHLHCNYGHCLTGHKSQGSEFSEVLVVLDDSMGMLRGVERRRYLYTVFTRGKNVVRYTYLKGRAA